MGNRRQLKKERSQVFQLLADTYAEHKELDQLHEIGKDKNCQICKRHEATILMLNRLKTELDVT